MNKKRTNFIFRVKKNGKTVDRYQTHSKRRFYNRIGTINWQDGPFKVYLRVSYGLGKDVFGRKTNLYNDGEYENKEELMAALRAFVEEDGN